MYCISPIQVRNDLVPCQQCRTCRINRRRDWQARLLLEAATSKYSAFVTLTYRDPPVGPFFPSLRPEHLRDFWKRWRFHHGFLRYLAVGEYGEQFGRPHYHALMFTDRPIDSYAVSDIWRLGSVDIGDVEPASIDYVMAYVLKAQFKAQRLDGFCPEFARHSLGIGKFSLSEFRRLARPDDDGQLAIPAEVRIGGKLFPLPKYLKRRLKDEGFEITPSSRFPDARRALSDTLQGLYESSSPFNPGYQDTKTALQRDYLSGLRNRAAVAHQRVLHNIIESKRNETL